MLMRHISMKCRGTRVMGEILDDPDRQRWLGVHSTRRESLQGQFTGTERYLSQRWLRVECKRAGQGARLRQEKVGDEVSSTTPVKSRDLPVRRWKECGFVVVLRHW